MRRPTLEELTAAIEASWSLGTMYATKEPSRKPGDRSRGQCGTTALVVHDWLGGEILAAEVLRDGELVGMHYWNGLPDGSELDLTGGQLLDNEALMPTRVAPRPDDLSGHPGYVPYRLLADRVRAFLEVEGAGG